MKTVDALKSYLASDHFDPKSVAEVAGVGVDAVHRWKKKGRVPIGEILLRVRFLLFYVGYQVDELSQLPKDLFLAAEAVALRLVLMKWIADLLGLTEDSARRVLLGSRETQPDNIEQVVTWYHEQGMEDFVEEGREKMKKILGVAGAPLACDAGGHQQFIVSAVANLKALEYFTARLETDEFTEEERQLFRDLGHERVMRVANQLFRLTSKTSRQELMRKEGEKAL